jgi:hypothetical protein
MKTFTLVSVFAALISTTSFAGTLTCSQPGNTAYLFVAKTGAPGVNQTASFKVPGEAGARKLSCVTPAIEPNMGGHKGGDQTYPIMSCSDTGYQVSVTGGGQTGVPRAIVTPVSGGKFGSKIVISLMCTSK